MTGTGERPTPGAAPEAGPETGPESELTVVVPARQPAVDEEATIVVAKPVVDPAATEPVVQPAAEVDSDATVVRPRTPQATAAGAEQPGEGRGIPRETGRLLLPPAPLPEQLPRDLASLGHLPQVYGARQAREALGPLATPAAQDTVEQQHGPAPAAAYEEPTAPRPALPSLVKRYRKERTVTLAAYAGAIVVSAVGLIVIARIAFF